MYTTQSCMLTCHGWTWCWDFRKLEVAVAIYLEYGNLYFYIRVKICINACFNGCRFIFFSPLTYRTQLWSLTLHFFLWVALMKILVNFQQCLNRLTNVLVTNMNHNDEQIFDQTFCFFLYVEKILSDLFLRNFSHSC